MKKILLPLALSALLGSTAFGQSMSLKFDGPVPPPAPESGEPAISPDYTQGTTMVPLDADVYRLIDRYAILYGTDSIYQLHTSVRPYPRAAVARLAERMLADSANLSAEDRFNAEYLLRDNWNYSSRATAPNQRAQPIVKHFYKRKSDLYSVSTPDFTLRVNPVLGLSLGNSDGSKSYAFLNTRGVQLEGTIDKRLGFYTFLADNQMAVPEYIEQRIGRDLAVPHEGFWKPFKNTPGQYDFLSARGYLTYAAGRHVNIQLGHDRNQIGNGYRSLILSDYSAPYLFLKLNTRIWKFNYQNLFAQLVSDAPNVDASYERKYLAMHHLSFDVLPNLNVGVFESVVYSGYSSTVDTILVTQGGRQQQVVRPRRRGFELQYLNPIIFYRAVEQGIGSEDNALLGLDFKWNIRQRVQLYGQVILDEFVLSQIRSGNGWWANKQGVQLGAKYVNVAGIRTLDVQGEFNYIRPYLYQHEDKYRNYQHYQQPLAHPMGANLWELIGIVSYQPLPRLNVVAKGFYVKQGLDPAGENYGSNPNLPYTNRPLGPDGQIRQYDFRVGDGATSYLFHGDFTASWQAAHNLWLDGKLIVRHRTLDQPVSYATAGTSALASVGLRWNIAQRLHEL
ncbi:hypothetical protein [Hymenobacter psychrotolerans]|uniref:Capsule assembly protein Wzi n=1 Tax=Hymenobacter psychrotolerans DSM 18569 TaxID=1121959 RepID=A0A1M6YYV9_9BACT|nr:hypothetical protein [Hymenobacter psychrotolerans]SHL23249.1 hypothetical protein SAMN02746009_02367 [Hymenobacter psychrotolerans DSM 18569]